MRSSPRVCTLVLFIVIAVDVVYEHVQKRTYLVMLIQVGLFLPLLIGLLLLYPWLAGSRKIDYSQENLEQMEEEEKTTGLMTENAEQ